MNKELEAERLRRCSCADTDRGLQVCYSCRHMGDHKSREEVRQCALNFGECWENPQTIADRKDFTNYPKGVSPTNWANY